jgi:hypothetical protein
MFDWTEATVEFEAYPDVMTPSKKAPDAALLLSPPIPRTMPPS